MCRVAGSVIVQLVQQQQACRDYITQPPHPQWDKPRQMAILAFFQRKPMFHRIVSALKFLAATISNSCGFVQRPATKDLHILFSIVLFSQFLLDQSRHSRRLVEGGRGGGDVRVLFVSSKTCIRTGFCPFRILAELILRFGVVRVQNWPKIRFFTGKAVFLWFEGHKSRNKLC